jgi:hypothetical protein
LTKLSHNDISTDNNNRLQKQLITKTQLHASKCFDNVQGGNPMSVEELAGKKGTHGEKTAMVPFHPPQSSHLGQNAGL